MFPGLAAARPAGKGQRSPATGRWTPMAAGRNRPCAGEHVIGEDHDAVAAGVHQAHRGHLAEVLVLDPLSPDRPGWRGRVPGPRARRGSGATGHADALRALRITVRPGLRRAATPEPCRAKVDATPGNR